jgi:hypothetical protein
MVVIIVYFEEYKDKLFELWYKVEKENSGLSHYYDGYDDGRSRGLAEALELLGVTKEQRDAYYNNHM